MNKANKLQKVLFLTTIEFRPPISGGTLYSQSIYQHLVALFDVDVVVLKDQRHFQNGKIHAALTALKGLFSKTPLNVIFHSSGINDINLDNYDWIVVDHIESVGAIGGSTTPFVLVAHNLEYKLATDKLPNRFARGLFQLTNRLRRYEYRTFSAARGVICISANEMDEISAYSQNICQILPSFPEKPLSNIPSDKIRFGFLGPAGWPPNARTVDNLTMNVLPQLDRDFTFVLAGAGWEASNADVAPNTHILGFVKDTAEFWENIDYLLAPTILGAGVNVKICEALHYGVNVITNTTSAKAIFGHAELPENVTIADTNAELVTLLNQIEPPTGICAQGMYSHENAVHKLAAFWDELTP